MDKKKLHFLVYEVEDGIEYAGKVSLGEKYMSYSMRFNDDSITESDPNINFRFNSGNLGKISDLTERQALTLCRLLWTAARKMYENPLRVRERVLFLEREADDLRPHSFCFNYTGEDLDVFRVFEK